MVIHLTKSYKFDILHIKYNLGKLGKQGGFHFCDCEQEPVS